MGVQVKRGTALPPARLTVFSRGRSGVAVDVESLNSPRWPRVSRGGFHEAWFVSGSDAKAGHGLWLRYGVNLDSAGARDSSLWGSWFERDAPERTFVVRNLVNDATISRTGLLFGAAELTASGCTGEVEGADMRSAGGFRSARALQQKKSFRPGCRRSRGCAPAGTSSPTPRPRSAERWRWTGG